MASAVAAFVNAPARAITLKVVKVDSEETAGEDGKGSNAVDGNPDTIWHTQWQDASPACPHEITIQLDPPSKIKGLTYLPRQGDAENGMIKDYEIYVSEDGKDFGQPVKTGTFERGHEKKTVVFETKQAGFIKLVAKSEINGEAWTSAAEIGVVGEGDKVEVKPSLKVVSADSEETAGEDGHASNAVDGKPDTFWHTQWQDANPPCPHEIVIQLNPPGKIKGFTYLPRQEGENGRIKDYEFYVSEDGKVFGSAVAKGSWENNADKKAVSFDAKQCGFIKLKALSEVNGEAWTSAAEIDVVPASD
jgi:endo-alpha-N-acetylgalactosaminidase